VGRIDEMFDCENATLLHVGANYNNHEIVSFFLQGYDRQAATQPEAFSP
jgi:ankyrin repeat protein